MHSTTSPYNIGLLMPTKPKGAILIYCFYLCLLFQPWILTHSVFCSPVAINHWQTSEIHIIGHTDSTFLQSHQTTTMNHCCLPNLSLQLSSVVSMSVLLFQPWLPESESVHLWLYITNLRNSCARYHWFHIPSIASNYIIDLLMPTKPKAAVFSCCFYICCFSPEYSFN